MNVFKFPLIITWVDKDLELVNPNIPKVWSPTGDHVALIHPTRVQLTESRVPPPPPPPSLDGWTDEIDEVEAVVVEPSRDLIIDMKDPVDSVVWGCNDNELAVVSLNKIVVVDYSLRHIRNIITCNGPITSVVFDGNTILTSSQHESIKCTHMYLGSVQMLNTPVNCKISTRKTFVEFSGMRAFQSEEGIGGFIFGGDGMYFV